MIRIQDQINVAIKHLGVARSQEPLIMHIAVIVSALLLGLLVFLINSTAQQETGLSNTGLPSVQTYDYRMVGLDYTQYDAEDKPSYRLLADQLSHYPNPEYNLIDSPHFEIYQQQEMPWTITARSARLEQDSILGEQRVDLSNSVVIQGVDSQGRELQIYTEFLSLYPDSKKFSTDGEVRIEGAGSLVFGTGMTANLSTRQITLLSNVRASYEHEPN